MGAGTINILDIPKKKQIHGLRGDLLKILEEFLLIKKRIQEVQPNHRKSHAKNHEKSHLEIQVQFYVPPCMFYPGLAWFLNLYLPDGLSFS